MRLFNLVGNVHAISQESCDNGFCIVRVKHHSYQRDTIATITRKKTPPTIIAARHFLFFKPLPLLAKLAIDFKDQGLYDPCPSARIATLFFSFSSNRERNKKKREITKGEKDTWRLFEAPETTKLKCHYVFTRILLHTSIDYSNGPEDQKEYITVSFHISRPTIYRDHHASSKILNIVYVGLLVVEVLMVLGVISVALVKRVKAHRRPKAIRPVTPLTNYPPHQYMHFGNEKPTKS
ncbi:hypothetical protein NXS19_005043 [Fusarium pseudograminearum]|nr:hypothetical protein NXS19_005043 [Fusarium pseudograminearum]